MKNEWFLDVLKDLKAFAEANDLCTTAEQLDEVREIAQIELGLMDDVILTELASANETGRPRRIH